MSGIARQQAQNLGAGTGHVHPHQVTAYAIGQCLFNAALVQQAQSLAHGGLQGTADTFALFRLRQPLPQTRCRVQAAQLFQQHGGVQKVVAYKDAQAFTQAVFLVGNNRSMWKRQAQRVAEQGHDGKPVCQRTDGAGLAKGTQPGPKSGNGRRLALPHHGVA